MQAIVVQQFGGADVLSYETVPDPVPGRGQVRVKVEAAGLNFIDTYQRSGLYPVPLPTVLGEEAAGTVDAVGPQVSGFEPGDRVAYVLELGAYAEYATVPAERLVPVPNNIDLKAAAAVMLQGLTAHFLSHSTYPVQAGDTVLIHAAAGGVGQLLVQMTKRLGAFVIGTVSTREKARLATEAGADHVILYTESDFETGVKDLTGGTGVNVVYDSVGQATFESSLNCLKRRGHMVLFGQSSGAVPPFNIGTLAAKGSLSLTRPSLGDYVSERTQLLQRAGDLFGWMAAGHLKLNIDRVFALDQAAEAHRYMEARNTKGKVLLVP